MAPQRSKKNFTKTNPGIELVNRKTTYEITITNKLEQLPLPDLADEIWQRIETRLDIELPGDDGQGGSAPKGGGSFPFGWGAMIFLTVLVTYFFIRKSNDTNNPIPPPPVSPITGSPKKPDPPLREPVNTNFPSSPQIQVKDKAQDVVFTTDSINNVPGQTAIVTSPESLSVQPPVILPQQSAPKEQVTKKAKGVTNISDSDYKVIPKKDSSN